MLISVHHLNKQSALPSYDATQSAPIYIDLSDPAVMARLIASLKTALQLRDGMDLPFILGVPQAEDNVEALVLWVTMVLKTSDWVEAGEVFNFLIAELRRTLSRFFDVEHYHD